MPFEMPKNFQPFTIKKEEDSERFRPLTIEEKEELDLEEKRREIASPVLRAFWKNPENQNERKIEFDIQKEIQVFDKIYSDKLGIKIDQKEVVAIWNRNFESIKKEIETYGYDTVLIIPENLPDEAVVNEKIIETMDEGVGKGKIKQTWQNSNFTDGGSFAGVRNLEAPKYRIILTKGEQNMSETNDPILKAIWGKNILGFTGLSEPEIANRIQKGGELPINFKTTVAGKEMEIKAEGLSLSEYMIFQGLYFEKNKKHLDEKGWTWLTKSCSGSRVVRSRWGPVSRQLYVGADDSSVLFADLGLRLSRSFSS